MTKKEREAFAALEKRLRTTAALRWTEPTPFNVAVPAYGKDSSGFAFNAYNLTVEPAWSSSAAHGIGYATAAAQRAAGMSGRQHGRPLHSTRQLALRAMRNAVEQQAAETLAKVDAMIEAELAASQGGAQ